MFVKTCMPPPNDFDLWPRNPKSNRGHQLVMTNHHTKLEDPWAMSSLVIDRTRFVYIPTDRLTYRWTDMCKAIYLHFFEGGHNKYSSLWSLTIILLELKVISLCHHYRARPVCTSVQFDQALYCWLTIFKFSSLYP